MISLPTPAGLILLCWIADVLIYRVFFHPLAKYPGPLLAKITGWYEYPSVSAGNHHLFLNQLHEKHGHVVRVGPNRLSYNTTEALQNIYGDRKANVKKAGFIETLALLHGGDRNVQTINDHRLYAPRRRLLSHAFSEEALRSSEDYILSRIRVWCDVISSKATNSWTPGIDMHEWATILTVDILGELCFGEAFKATEEGFTPHGETITNSAKQAQILSYAPIGPLNLVRLYMAVARRYTWASARPQLNYERAIGDMIARRDQSKQVRKDFYHYVLQATDPETNERITPAEINVECSVLFSGGTDTSAACIAACIFYLTRYPDTLNKLLVEIRSTSSEVEQIRQGPALNSLVYLRACIDETLRLSPGAPGPMMREVTAGGLTIEGQYVPEGIQVSVPAYAIHHNATYFPEPWTFKPERWLDGSQEADKAAFIPFSMGTRSCIGRNLAYLDITLVLARLLFLFDVRGTPGDRTGEGEPWKVEKVRVGRGREKEYQLQDWFITGRKGPVVQLRAR